jgi:hypothetical protein
VAGAILDLQKPIVEVYPTLCERRDDFHAEGRSTVARTVHNDNDFFLLLLNYARTTGPFCILTNQVQALCRTDRCLSNHCRCEKNYKRFPHLNWPVPLGRTSSLGCPECSQRDVINTVLGLISQLSLDPHSPSSSGCVIQSLHFSLMDVQFAKLEPYLPTDTRGKERIDDRRVISGIVQAIRSGGRWAR